MKKKFCERCHIVEVGKGRPRFCGSYKKKTGCSYIEFRIMENECVKRYRATCDISKIQSYKKKCLARQKVFYAISVGKMNKPKKCEVCNKVLPIQAHHEDYSKPLKVMWLCPQHHSDRHKELKKRLLVSQHPKC